MVEQSLKEKTVKGVAWNSIGNFSTLGVSFIFSIILARILGPEAYGTIALLGVFISISNVFVDSGFAAALIRKPDLSERDKCTAFYFNIIVGLVCYAFLWGISAYISYFYKQPILSPLLKVIGICIIVGALSIVQQTELTILIDFKKLAIISLMSALLSGCVGFFCAFHGMGVWALAYQQVSNSFLRTFFLWGFCRWYPKKGFSKKSFHYLFGFGSKLMISSLIDRIYSNLYTVVIGKAFSTRDLGLYNRAESIASLPSTSINGILQSVTFPILSKIQNDDKILSINYRRMLRMSAFVTFPLMMILAGIASPLVHILLSEKWEGCSTFLQIMCFSYMWYPVHSINLNLLKVKGFSNIFLKLEIIKRIIGVLILIITFPLGLYAMCYGGVIVSLVSLYANTYYTSKLINLSLWQQIKDLTPMLILSFIVFLNCLIWVSLINNTYACLIFSIISSSIIYFIMSYFISIPEFTELINIIKSR